MKYFPARLFLFSLLFSFYITGTGQQVDRYKKTDSLFKQWDYTTPEIFNVSSEIIFDSAQLIVFVKKYPQVKKYLPKIRSFYRKRNFYYAWYQNDSLTSQAINFSNRMLNLESEGVYKKMPYQEVLDSMLKRSLKQRKMDVKLELMLTAQYFIFSKVAWEGMDAATSKSAE